MSQRKFERAARQRRLAAGRRESGRRRTGVAAAGAVGAVVLFAPAAANAATFQVDKTTDGAPGGACDAGAAGDCSLRDAITLANANAEDDTITFGAGVTGTITLNQGQLPITAADALDIQGPGANALTISGADESRVFAILTGSGAVKISGLTVTNGDGSPDAGGADAQGEGGAILTEAGLTLVDSVVTGSKATNGGGIASADGSGEVALENGHVNGNEADGTGGGIESGDDLTLTSSTVSGNTAATGGGGVAQQSEPDRNNPKYALSTSDTTVAGNEAFNGSGGGVLIDAQTTKYTFIERTTVSGNKAVGQGGTGGGIDFRNTVYGLAQIINSTIATNQSGGAGGGIHVGSNFVVERRGSAAGRAEEEGGPSFGTLGVDNTTVADNDSDTTGGGIAIEANAVANEAVELSSTIVGDNTATSADKDLSNDPGGDDFNSEFSLVETPGGATLNTDPAKPTITGQDPQLGALGSNGGPTQTKLPAEASPAIDQGDANGLDVEQRKTARTVDLAPANASDGTDIGAVEIASKPPVPPAAGTPPATPVPVLPSATPTICGRRAISLVRADRKGKKVKLTGLVGASLYGKKVTIQTDLRGAKSSKFTKTKTIRASSPHRRVHHDRARTGQALPHQRALPRRRGTIQVTRAQAAPAAELASRSSRPTARSRSRDGSTAPCSANGARWSSAAWSAAATASSAAPAPARTAATPSSSRTPAYAAWRSSAPRSRSCARRARRST